ncbi:MAG TPA: DNA internalization-related competence protein ComEC/Rec2 [Ramlibacter sp.]|nr:DNA internalization-related competence protein ComEC/Rec2 [Ramlibacter sp.]
MDPPSVPGRLWVPLLVGAVLGTAAQVRQEELWGASGYAAVAAAGLALLSLLPRAGSRGAAALLAAACLAFALAGARAAAFSAAGLDPALEGRDLAVTGVVAAMPQRNELGQRLRLRIESAHDGSQPVRLPRLASLAWYHGAWASGAVSFELQRVAPDLRAGERWRFTVRLRAPHGNLNPHGFDYELWLWEQGLQATGYVRAGPNDPAPARLAATWRHPVEQARQAVRDAIQARVADRASAGVIAALVVGDQNAIERSDWDVFRATGVAHLMSISGLHVTMFAWLAAAVVGAAWRRSPWLCLAWPAPLAAVLGGLLLAAAYALFSGWGVPAQRTLLMLAGVAFLRLSARQWPWPVTWLFACAVVVTADPWALMQPGFWLSFVAVGVLFATDAGVPAQPVRWRARAVRLLREQVVVTLALAPLTLLLFGQASIVGLVANLLAIPWVTLLVTPLAMAGVLLPPLWDLAAWAVQVLGAVLQAMAGWPFAVWSQATPPTWIGAAGVLGGLLLAMRWPPPLRALGVPLLLPALLWQAPRPAPGEFELLAADVGQGNAVLVRTATATLVYDAGPRYGAESDAGQRVLVPLLRALGEPVERLVLSHRDSDHTGGAAAVLTMQPRAQLLAAIEPTHLLAALRPIEACAAGQRWTRDGVGFEVLHPPPGEGLGAAKANTVSCVLRVSNGRRSALLAGDIEQAQESRLVRVGASLPSDVLLVPHHGSKTSSSAAFLEAVRPRWAVVQAGYRNRFGHPAPEVLERYAANGAEVVETARCGAAWWTSQQPDRMRCERQDARRYWHHRLP